MVECVRSSLREVRHIELTCPPHKSDRLLTQSPVYSGIQCVVQYTVCSLPNSLMMFVVFERAADPSAHRRSLQLCLIKLIIDAVCYTLCAQRSARAKKSACEKSCLSRNGSESQFHSHTAHWHARAAGSDEWRLNFGSSTLLIGFWKTPDKRPIESAVLIHRRFTSKLAWTAVQALN